MIHKQTLGRAQHPRALLKSFLVKAARDPQKLHCKRVTKTNWDERSSQWTPRAVSCQPHPHGLNQCSPSGPRPCAAGMLPSGFLQPEAQPCLLLGYMGHPGMGQKTAQLIISYHNRLLQRFFPLLLNHCCFNKGW